MICRKINNHKEENKKKIQETQQKIIKLKTKFNENKVFCCNLLLNMSKAFENNKKNIINAVLARNDDINTCREYLETLKSNTFIEIQEIKSYIAEFSLQKLSLANNIQDMQQNMARLLNENKESKATISKNLQNYDVAISVYKNTLISNLNEISSLKNHLSSTKLYISTKICDLECFTNKNISKIVNTYKDSLKNKLQTLKNTLKKEKALMVNDLEAYKINLQTLATINIKLSKNQAIVIKKLEDSKAKFVEEKLFISNVLEEYKNEIKKIADRKIELLEKIYKNNKEVEIIKENYKEFEENIKSEVEILKKKNVLLIGIIRKTMPKLKDLMEFEQEVKRRNLFKSEEEKNELLLINKGLCCSFETLKTDYNELKIHDNELEAHNNELKIQNNELSNNLCQLRHDLNEAIKEKYEIRLDLDFCKENLQRKDTKLARL